jgi:hypothetical protein
VLFFWISDRRSRGEESREEKRIAGPESSAGESEEVDIGGCDEAEAVVGGLAMMVGNEDSRREA